MSAPPPPPEFVVTVRAAPGGTVVAAAGEIDLVTVPELGDAARRALAEGPVALDLSEVTFMDSSGLRLLDELVRETERDGRTLTLRPVLQAPVRRALEITGMLDGLPFEEEEGA